MRGKRATWTLDCAERVDQVPVAKGHLEMQSSVRAQGAGLGTILREFPLSEVPCTCCHKSYPTLRHLNSRLLFIIGSIRASYRLFQCHKSGQDFI